MKNHVIIRLVASETGNVIRAFEGNPGDVVLFNDNITQCFINQSGGISIIIDLEIDFDL